MQTDLTFQAWLKQTRRERGLTQETLAGLAGCSTDYLKKIEAGRRQPSRQVIDALLDALQIQREARSTYVALALAAPAPTTSPPPRNLPAPLTSFVGREDDLAAIEALLRRSTVRLVTLTGPGGVGKTRLALEAAADLLDQFEDGVYFVNLATIADPTLVASTIAQALDIREPGGKSLLDSVKAWLREKSSLLVLDNFEQITDAAPLISDLLAAAPRLTVLVTSRAVLHLSGEYEFPVPPLAVPPRDERRRANDPSRETAASFVPASITQYDAVRLFIERATAVKPGFAVTNENAPAVAEICYRLDGLPLAIELAAARIKLFPPQALLQRLGSRLKLLTGGARDLPARQQTLRNTIEWSYGLLSQAEQRLFRRLAVFVGGWGLEAAEVVGADEVLDGIASLADKNLVRPVETGEGEPRFVMLETIREYAVERLTESGEADAVRRAHAEYYRKLAEEGAGQNFGPAQMRWLDWFGREQDNLRAALQYSLEAGNAALALGLVASISNNWVIPGLHTQVRGWAQWVQQVLALPGADHLTRARARALTAMGALVYQGYQDYADAGQFYAEAVALWRQVGDKRELATTLSAFGRAAWELGDYETGQAYLRESLALFEAVGSERGALWARQGLGLIALGVGDTRTALSLFEGNVAGYRQKGNAVELALALLGMGRAFMIQGDYAAAEPFLVEGVALARTTRNAHVLSITLNPFGYVALHLGDVTRARALHIESLSVARAAYHPANMSSSLVGLAGVAAAVGQPERAATILGAVQAAREALGAPLTPENRVEYERTMAGVRDHLDEARFATAWAKGHAMTLEQAVAYALETEPGDP